MFFYILITTVRHFAKSENLPEYDSKAPDIALNTKGLIVRVKF